MAKEVLKFLKILSLCCFIVSCDGSSGDDENQPSLEDSLEELEELSEDEENSDDLSDLDELIIDLSERQGIRFTGLGEQIVIPHNPAFDVWSNNKEYSLSINVVKESSDGSAFVPLIARGESSYSIKIDHTNSNIEIKGEDGESAHTHTVSFDDAILARTDDGTINLPVTITRSANGVEKWYLSNQLVKTFYGLSTESSSEDQPIKIGCSDAATNEFRGTLDMVSIWNKELSLSEVTELITEYNPEDHSNYEDHAISVWPLGEDIGEGNTAGETVFDIKNGLHGNTENMEASNFAPVDLEAYDALPIDNYTEVTLTIVDATDAIPINNAVIYLIGADDTYETSTDEFGTFSLSDIPVRPYTLNIVADGYVEYATTFNPQASNNISLSPESSGDVTNNFRLVLSWNELPQDMDIHCLIYDDSDNFFAFINYNQEEYVSGSFNGSLDNDETGGFGPETITLTELPEGYTFVLYVNNYSRSPATSTSNSTVSVYQGNQNLAEYNISDVINPEFVSDRWWKVATFNNNTLTAHLEYIHST